MPTPRAAQPPKGDEQPRHFVGRQAGGRLVEHQDFGVGRQRAGDRHERLLGARQVMDPQIGVDVGTDDLEGALGARARRVPVDQAEAARKAEHERDVLGNRHPLDQTKILVDVRDRQATQRVGDVAAAVGHRAGVERMDAGEDLDERRLAGAVLAQERHDLACADVDPRVD